MKLTLAAGLALLFAGCAPGPGETPTATEEPPQKQTAKTAPRKPMPAFKYKTMEGKTVRLADYKGKVLVFDIFSPT